MELYGPLILDEDSLLIADDDNGRTGPAYLYEIWGKVKTKDKTTIITKEIATYFSRSRDELFMDKLPVIPAFYRDLNTQAGDEKNSQHSLIISIDEASHTLLDFLSLL